MPPKHGAQQRRCIHGRLARRDRLILPGKTFEDAFAHAQHRRRAAVEAGDKHVPELPGTELSANNGIETSPDDREFYVASTTTQTRRRFSRAKPAWTAAHAQLKDSGPTTFAGPRRIV